MSACTFDAASVARLAQDRLYRSPPPQASDPALAARASDDDLNPGLAASANHADPRPAAVLIGLVRRQPELTVLLTRRTRQLPTHGGQVAFPGGKIEQGDENILAAALREAREEIGLDAGLVEPLGYLDAYQTRTGFRITPVVALVDPAIVVRPDPSEVDEVFETPFGFLMNPANHRVETRRWQGHERRFYAMPHGRHYIWGATAGMLRNLYVRLYGAVER